MRGTPQQIIDKYLLLARDAQLSNDRVAAENFLQHAEHYTRLLTEGQREMAREAEARREAQEAQNRNQQRQRDDGRSESGDGAEQPSVAADHPASQGERPRGGRDGQRRAASAPEVMELKGGDDDTGLVETPESRDSASHEATAPTENDAQSPQDEEPRRAPRRRSPRKPKAEANAAPESSAAE